jgi:tellurite resistance protein
MGLLAKVTANATPTKKATDDVLLLHGMMLMAAADGVIEAKEMATVEAFFYTLPEFDNKDFDELIGEANKVVARFGTLRESVKALAEIESDAVKKKCFVLAADIAMSSGDVAEPEDQLLDAYQRLLGIDDATGTKVLEVLAMKYAK